MKKWFNLRDWHLWIGIVTAIPILIIAVSTVFLVHKGLNFNLRVPALFQSAAMIKDLRSVSTTSEQTWLAGKFGLIQIDHNGQLKRYAELGELFDIQPVNEQQLLAAGKRGLWLLSHDSAPQRLLQEEIRTLTNHNDMLFATSKNRWWASQDGGLTWQNGSEVFQTSYRNELRSVMLLDADTLLLAGKEGLYRHHRQTGLERLSNDQKFYDIAAQNDQILLAAEDGIWSLKTTGLERVWRGEKVESLTAAHQAVYGTGKYQVVYQTTNNSRWRNWSAPKSLSNITQSDKSNQQSYTNIEVKKLMKSLHTGKFLGKYDWIWADLIALSLLLFVMSGVYLWWRGRKRALQQISDG